MKPWRVIFATVVIFIAGFFTGGAIDRKLGFGPDASSPEGNGDPPFLPREVKEEYVRRMAKDLELNSQQKEAISLVVSESQHRIRILFELVGPEMREEMKQVRDSIRALLTPEQQKKFDEMRKHRRSRSQEGNRSRRGLSTNQPSPSASQASPMESLTPN